MKKTKGEETAVEGGNVGVSGEQKQWYVSQRAWLEKEPATWLSGGRTFQTEMLASTKAPRQKLEMFKKQQGGQCDWGQEFHL